MNEKINFQSIIALLAEKSGITKKEAEGFLKEYFETINEALMQDKIVKIKNLGNLKLIEVSDRESIDVTTGNRVLIPAHNKINFIPDNDLAQMVNEPFSFFEVTELESMGGYEENENNEKNEEDENEEHEEHEEHESEDIPQRIEENYLAPEIKNMENIETEMPVGKSEFQEEYEDKKERKIKWASIFVGISLLIIVSLFYYLYTIDKKEFAFSSKLFLNEKAAIDTVKTQIDTIKTQIDTIKTQINKIESIITPDKKRTVRTGERLTLIALDEYGHKSFWVYLYLENKNSIKNPNNIPVGLKIKIPPAEKYGINKNDSEAIKKAKALEKEIIP